MLAILERKIGVSQTPRPAMIGRPARLPPREAMQDHGGHQKQRDTPLERSATSVDGGRGRLVPIAQERADPTELAEGFIVLDDLHAGACGHGQPHELAAQRLV